ncbi:MAG: 1-(5-phosphoribosyl)-5-[(5-phosphoribosylamino)methylideneamino]imidazole-4-carboxamide isomerase [Actinomycetota bacterium]
MTFEVIPSVDILQGQVVRLRRGEPQAKTVYSDDPVAVAKDWEAQGATRLHVVDLDGALAGEPSHQEMVMEILRKLDIPVQVAGGIRSVDAGRRWIANGADRVVFGTAALTDIGVLHECVEAFGPRLIVAPDALGREVRVAGWTEGTGEDVVDAVRRLAAAGVQRLLVTDIGRDGMLAGPNVDLLADVADAAGVPIIASGGVSSVDDLKALATVDGIEGAIVGQALYTGAIELTEAVMEVA